MIHRRSLAPRVCPLALAAALAGLPSLLSAQTQPLPTLPPPEGEEPIVRSSWDYSLGLGETWVSDLTPSGPSDFATLARGTLEGTQRRPSRQLRLQLEGEGRAYAGHSALNRFDASAGFDSQLRLSRRTTGELAVAFEHGHSDTSTVLVDQVVYVPLTTTRGYATVATLRHRATSALTLRAGGRAYRMEFPDDPALPDSTSVRLTAAADRSFGLRNMLALEYSAGLIDLAEATAGGSGSLWTHYQSAQWTHTFSPRLATLVEGGVSYTPQFTLGALSRSWDFFGGLSLNRKLRRGSLSAYYRREVLPSFGVRVAHLAHRVGLAAKLPMGRHQSITLRTLYGREVQQGESADPAQSVMDVSMRLARFLGWRLMASLEGRYRRQTAPALLVEEDDYRAALLIAVVPAKAGRPEP